DLEKETVIIGVSSRIEIWSKSEWDDVFNEAEESFADLAENMIGFDI
ncbi:division/cell wall cluster transcriptional repressor MraZ, partial [Listeria monocytogenes]